MRYIRVSIEKKLITTFMFDLRSMNNHLMNLKFALIISEYLKLYHCRSFTHVPQISSKHKKRLLTQHTKSRTQNNICTLLVLAFY